MARNQRSQERINRRNAKSLKRAELLRKRDLKRAMSASVRAFRKRFKKELYEERRLARLARKSKNFAPQTIATTSDRYYAKDPRQANPVTYSNHGSVLVGNNFRVLVDDPNWKIKVAKKQDATNPYTMRKHSGHCGRIAGTSVTYIGPAGYTISNGETTAGYFPTVTAWGDPSLQDLALKRIKRKIGNHVGNYNVMTPLVELRELRKGCVQLIDSAADMVQRYNALRYGNPTRFRGKSLRSAAANLWLQWSFGIKPILADIDKANEAIDTWLTRKDHLVHLTGGSGTDRLISRKDSIGGGIYGTTIEQSMQGIEYLRYKYVGSFNLEFSSSNVYNASGVFGISLEDAVSSVYELTPYSWLLDYFTSVGDYMDDTFEAPPGFLKFLSLTRVHLREETLMYKYVKAGVTVITDQHATPGERLYKEIIRSKLTTLPHLGLRIKTLDEIGNGWKSKLANLTSLVTSAHGRRREDYEGVGKRKSPFR